MRVLLMDSSSSLYFKETVFVKEASNWLHCYAMLYKERLCFKSIDRDSTKPSDEQKKSKKNVEAMQKYSKKFVEITRQTQCFIAKKKCHRFPFVVQTGKIVTKLKCDTHLQRYRWMYAIRACVEGRPPGPVPTFIETENRKPTVASSGKASGGRPSSGRQRTLTTNSQRPLASSNRPVNKNRQQTIRKIQVKTIPAKANQNSAKSEESEKQCGQHEKQTEQSESKKGKQQTEKSAVPPDKTNTVENGLNSKPNFEDIKSNSISSNNNHVSKTNTNGISLSSSQNLANGSVKNAIAEQSKVTKKERFQNIFRRSQSNIVEEETLKQRKKTVSWDMRNAMMSHKTIKEENSPENNHNSLDLSQSNPSFEPSPGTQHEMVKYKKTPKSKRFASWRKDTKPKDVAASPPSESSSTSSLRKPAVRGRTKSVEIMSNEPPVVDLTQQKTLPKTMRKVSRDDSYTVEPKQPRPTLTMKSQSLNNITVAKQPKPPRRETSAPVFRFLNRKVQPVIVS